MNSVILCYFQLKLFLPPKYQILKDFGRTASNLTCLRPMSQQCFLVNLQKKCFWTNIVKADAPAADVSGRCLSRPCGTVNVNDCYLDLGKDRVVPQRRVSSRAEAGGRPTGSSSLESQATSPHMELVEAKREQPGDPVANDACDGRLQS